MAAPKWQDSYRLFQAAHQAQFGQDMNRPWTADADAAAAKKQIDDGYLQALAEYNKANGTNEQPDRSVLGTNAQPNTFTPTDHSNDGFFGGLAKTFGMSTNDLGKLAAVVAGGYGLYSAGVFGGAGATAAGIEGTAALPLSEVAALNGTAATAAGSEFALTGGTGTFGAGTAASTGTAMATGGTGLTAAAGTGGVGAGLTAAGTGGMGLTAAGVLANGTAGVLSDAALADLGLTGIQATSAINAVSTGKMTTAELIKQFGPTAAKVLLGAVAANAAGDPGAGSGSGSANIDSLVSSALGNTASMEKDYNELFKPWAIDQVGKATARGDAGYDTLMGLTTAPNKNLASYQTYVDRIGSQGYRDQQRGQAMGEVQQQSDMGLASARRAAMARGVDPGKFALQANANSINTAAAKTKAAADAETGAWDQWGKGAQTASGMQIQDAQSRANLVTGANNVGLSGFNAGSKLALVDGGYRGGLTSGYNSTLGALTGATNAANNQSNYDKEHGLSGIVNAGLATAATKWLTDKGSDAISNIF